MTFNQFQDYVAANIDWFHGRGNESNVSLHLAEQALGVQLPRSLKWLLKEHGYWHGIAVSNLSDSVNDTLSCRRTLSLPNQFIVLENVQDAGAILIDTDDLASSGEAPLYWVASEDVGNPPRLDGNIRFDSYGDYVQHQLPGMQEFIESRYVRYNPADYPIER
jgi:hypothetical protein